MNQTSNYNLNLPEGTDRVNINDLNENFETLDNTVKLIEDRMISNETLDNIQSTINSNADLLNSINTNTSNTKTTATNTYNIVNNSTYGNSALKSAISSIASGYDYMNYLMDCVVEGKLYSVHCTNAYDYNFDVTITFPNYTRIIYSDEWTLNCNIDYIDSSNVLCRYDIKPLGYFDKIKHKYILSPSDALARIQELMPSYAWGKNPFYITKSTTQTFKQTSSLNKFYHLPFILENPLDIDNISIEVDNSATVSEATLKLVKILAISEGKNSSGGSITYQILKTIY